MIIYWVILVILGITSVLEVLLRHARKLLPGVFFVLLVILVSLASLRYGVGKDDYNYEDIYFSIQNAFFNNNKIVFEVYLEPGFVILNIIANILSNNIIAVFFLSSILAVGLNFRFYYKVSPYFALSVLLYFVHTFLYREMNQIRAGLACAICLNVVPLVCERKHFKALVGVLVASLFHSVAFIFILGYFFVLLNLKNNYLWYILGAALVIGLTYPFGRIFSTLFLGRSGDVEIISKASIYFSDSENTKLGVFSNPTTLKQLFFLICLMLSRKKLSCRVLYFNEMLLLYFLSVCWLIVFNDFAIISGRVATVFSIVEVILVPSLLLLFKFKSRIVVLAGIVLINICILGLNLEIVKPVGPYQTIFSFKDAK